MSNSLPSGLNHIESSFYKSIIKIKDLLESRSLHLDGSFNEVFDCINDALNVTTSSFDKKNLVTYFGNTTLNTETGELKSKDKRVILTRKETNLLIHFLRYPPESFLSKSYLLKEVWGYCCNFTYTYSRNTHV